VAAAEADTDPDGLAHTLEHAPELGPLREHPRVVALRQRLED
jgi:hypothetical protein